MGDYLRRHVPFRLMKLQVLGLHENILVMTQQRRQFSRPAATSVQAYNGQPRKGPRQYREQVGMSERFHDGTAAEVKLNW